MAILIDVDVEGLPCDGDVMCSECHAQFALQWKRSPDIVGVRYCPFCGDDIVDESWPPEGGDAT